MTLFEKTMAVLLGCAVVIVLAYSSYSTLQNMHAASSGGDLDLVAQQSMADAAWFMVMLTALTGVVGGLTLYLIFRTLQEAKRSADAGEAAVREARENTVASERIGKAQVRAYLGIREVSVTFGMADASLEFTVFNAGQSPGRAVSVYTSCPDEPYFGNSLRSVRFGSTFREAIGTQETDVFIFEATCAPPSTDFFVHALIEIDIEYSDVFNGHEQLVRRFILEAPAGVRLNTRYVLRPHTDIGSGGDHALRLSGP
jgi:hypothetical protein